MPNAETPRRNPRPAGPDLSAIAFAKDVMPGPLIIGLISEVEEVRPKVEPATPKKDVRNTVLMPPMALNCCFNKRKPFYLECPTLFVATSSLSW